MNYFAVFIAAVVAMAIGSFWYSPVGFGKQWMRLRGKKESEIKNMRFPAQSMILEFICALVTAYVLGIMTTVFGAHTFYSCILLSLVVWIGFYVTMLLGEVVWEDKPFGLFLINAGLRLVNVVSMTLIVGIWQ
jgi:hypothetical protein